MARAAESVCPECGGALTREEVTAKEVDSAGNEKSRRITRTSCPRCDEARRVSGSLFELESSIETGGPLAHDRWDETLQRLRHLACERFGHDEFALSTLRRLYDWLVTEHGMKPTAAPFCSRDRAVELLVKSQAAKPTTTPTDAKPPVEYYVTLTQMAAIAQVHKRTIARIEGFPPPDVEGKPGRAHQWKWSNVREVLERKFERPFPEEFPASQFVKR